MESKYLFTSPAPVREPEAVAPNPPSGDVREAAGDFESGSYVPGGARKDERGGLYWDWGQTSPTLYGVLIKDVPRLVNYINGRVAIGDTDAAQKAYNQLMQFTSANADNLQAYARGKPRNQAQALMTQRARALLDGSVISNEIVEGIRPENNKRSQAFFRAQHDASELAWVLDRKVATNTASNYERGLYMTARRLAAQENGGFDYSKRANAFLDYGKAAEKVFKSHFGGQDIDDHQAGKLAELVRTTFVIGYDEADHLKALDRMLKMGDLAGGGPDVSPQARIEMMQAARRGIDRALSLMDEDSNAGALMRMAGSGFMDELLDRYYKMRNRTPVVPEQVERELGQAALSAGMKLANAGHYDVASVADTVTEIALYEALPPGAKVNAPLSKKAQAYMSIDGQSTEAIKKLSGGDAVKSHLLAPVITTLARALQEDHGRTQDVQEGDEDVAGMLEGLLNGSLNDERAVRLLDVVGVAIDDQVRRLDQLMPGKMDQEAAKAFIVSSLVPAAPDRAPGPRETAANEWLTELKGHLESGKARGAAGDPASTAVRSHKAVKQILALREAADLNGEYVRAAGTPGGQEAVEAKVQGLAGRYVNSRPELIAAFNAIKGNTKVLSREDLGPEYNDPRLEEVEKTLGMVTIPLTEEKRGYRDTIIPMYREILSSDEVKPKVESLYRQWRGASSEDKKKLRSEFAELLGIRTSTGIKEVLKEGEAVHTIARADPPVTVFGTSSTASIFYDPSFDETVEITEEGIDKWLRTAAANSGLKTSPGRGWRDKIRMPKPGDAGFDEVYDAINRAQEIAGLVVAKEESSKSARDKARAEQKTRQDQVVRGMGFKPEEIRKYRAQFEQGKTTVDIGQRRQQAMAAVAWMRENAKTVSDIAMVNEWERALSNDETVLNFNTIVHQYEAAKYRSRARASATGRQEAQKPDTEAELPPPPED
jgi:hypothetical protein